MTEWFHDQDDFQSQAVKTTMTWMRMYTETSAGKEIADLGKNTVVYRHVKSVGDAAADTKNE